MQHYQQRRVTRPLAFTVSVMTFWKTVLYIAMFYELAGGRDFRKGNTLLEEVFLVLIPNGIWLLLPGLCMLQLWPDILPPLRQKTFWWDSNYELPLWYFFYIFKISIVNKNVFIYHFDVVHNDLFLITCSECVSWLPREMAKKDIKNTLFNCRYCS